MAAGHFYLSIVAPIILGSFYLYLLFLFGHLLSPFFPAIYVSLVLSMCCLCCCSSSHCFGRLFFLSFFHFTAFFIALFTSFSTVLTSFFLFGSVSNIIDCRVTGRFNSSMLTVHAIAELQNYFCGFK